jgi:hypothetical protein
MTNLVSIALAPVGFLGMCVFTQLVVDYVLAYVCRLLNQVEGGAQ